jgi:hypothetical protein
MAPKKCNIKYHIQLLKLITKSKPDDKAVILTHLNDKGIHFICEVIHNIINSKLHLSKKQRSKIREGLMSRKTCYRFLSKKKNNINKKRKIIKQNGAGIGLLLSAALPFAIQLLSPILTRNK